MPPKPKHKYADAILASLLLAFSSVLCAFAFRHVQLSDRFSKIDIGVLPIGSSHFSLMQGERCVGTLDAIHEHQELTRLRGEANLRVTFAFQEAPLHFAVEMFFNPLRQLVRSSASFRFLGSDMRMSTTDVFPIVANVDFNSPTGRIEQQLQLPGPILLSSDEKSGITIEYPGLREILPASLLSPSMAQKDLFQSLEIRVVPGDTACPKSSQGSLNLSGASLPALPAFPPLSSFVKSGSPS